MCKRFTYKDGVIFDEESTIETWSEYNLNVDDQRKALCNFLNKQQDLLNESHIREIGLQAKINERDSMISDLSCGVSKYKMVIEKLAELIGELV